MERPNRGTAKGPVRFADLSEIAFSGEIKLPAKSVKER
jgi:hypothetical protein